jgi:hypothetical protein
VIVDKDEIRTQLAQGNPVIVGMKTTKSFKDLKGPMLYSYTLDEPHTAGFHAVVVVGYDDTQDNGKGAFLILNSWGREWGHDGLGWMRYVPFINLTSEAYVFQAPARQPAPPPVSVASGPARPPTAASAPAPVTPSVSVQDVKITPAPGTDLLEIVAKGFFNAPAYTTIQARAVFFHTNDSGERVTIQAPGDEMFFALPNGDVTVPSVAIAASATNALEALRVVIPQTVRDIIAASPTKRPVNVQLHFFANDALVGKSYPIPASM